MSHFTLHFFVGMYLWIHAPARQSTRNLVLFPLMELKLVSVLYIDWLLNPSWMPYFHPPTKILLNMLSNTHLVIKLDNEKRKIRKQHSAGLNLNGKLCIVSHFALEYVLITCMEHWVLQGVARYVFLVNYNNRFI